MNSNRFRIGALASTGCLLLSGWLGGCTSPSGQGRFATPEAASDELVAALRTNDKARLTAVLGTDGVALLQSGDEVSDRTNLEAFLESYQTKHAIDVDGDEAVLVVGEDGWPLPLPLVKGNDSWQFDVVRGRVEILARRIGRNELSTIQVCRAIVDAQQEYAAADRSGKGAGEYAAKFLSTEGKQDGLYWPTAEGEPESPLGQLVADAQAEGYTAHATGTGERPPYHGYRYRILTAQGPSAPGGAMSYIVDGRMTGGFAVLAEPAEFGNSGVMTFMVGPAGIVYQRNLGKTTVEEAAKIEAFDPDWRWEVVED